MNTKFYCILRRKVLSKFIKDYSNNDQISVSHQSNTYYTICKAYVLSEL